MLLCGALALLVMCFLVMKFAGADLADRRRGALKPAAPILRFRRPRVRRRARA
jgi:hypothetical protein